MIRKFTLPEFSLRRKNGGSRGEGSPKKSKSRLSRSSTSLNCNGDGEGSKSARGEESVIRKFGCSSKSSEKLVLKLDRLNEKIGRFRSYLEFLKNCATEGVIPVGECFRDFPVYLRKHPQRCMCKIHFWRYPVFRFFGVLLTASKYPPGRSLLALEMRSFDEFQRRTICLFD